MKISIKEYAELKGISTQAVYKAIREGRLEVLTENGIKYIKNPAFSQPLKESSENGEINTLKRENEMLREQIEELRKDKDTLNQRLKESNIIQLKTVETLKQIEYKAEETEKDLQEEKKKTWWQKLLKK